MAEIGGIPVLQNTEEGLVLTDGALSMRGDFTTLLPRLKPERLSGELLVKAARIKGAPGPLVAVDATAGMGEDSLLLAAAGFQVELYESDPVIAALLMDTIWRAGQDPSLAPYVSRMRVHVEDSIQAMKALPFVPDVIYLDPMFPERMKSGLVKKKFQLLHQLERPCSDEEALLAAALQANPRKIVIKRPLKGPFLGGRKPTHSLSGKAIRYDCIALPH